jgi:integrase
VTVRGRIYYYHRATGERLPDDLEARRRRLLEISRGAKVVKSKRTVGTIGDLIFQFRNRAEYAKLKPNTRRAYGRFLAALEADFGDDYVAEIDREFLLELRDQMADTARSADMMIAVVKRLLDYAVDRPRQYGLEYNHAIGIKKIADNHPYEPWPEALVDAFRARAYPELVLAMELGLGTGQRCGDCLAMLWSAYDGEKIAVKQQKTGTKLKVRATAELKVALDAAPRKAAVILTSKTGRPWRADHFRPELARAVADLGFPGYSYHGLRKLAGKRLADAGCTEKQIAAVLGHKSLAMVQLYTEAADQERLADAAVTQLEQVRNQRLQNKKTGEGESK